MSHRALLAAAGAQGKTYVEDVFSAYPYVGNGSTQTITNGIDLTKGGLVWIKDRTSASYGHYLQDTIRGISNFLNTNLSSSEASSIIVTSSNSNSFALSNASASNGSGDSYASWTFRRAPKFFDVVTWTGDGTSNRQIPHALGIAPGMVTAKRRDSTGDWAVWHRSATGDLYLDTTAAQTGSFTQITAASATTFSVSGNANILNATYVAYAWAHDPDTVNGIVQCGSYTTTSGASAPINLGWEPQYVLLKMAGATSSWVILDTSRGLSNSTYSELDAQSSAAESNLASGLIVPNATGFRDMGMAAGSNTFIYLAIRRGPMRTPTSGASVYNAIARTGTGVPATVTGVGFAPDLIMSDSRTEGVSTEFYDRLRGADQDLKSASTSQENLNALTGRVVSFGVDGYSAGSTASDGSVNKSGQTYINWFFRRAPGVFDEVCDTGTGAAHTVAHNLSVAPEFIIRKGRSGATQWEVWHSALANTQKLVLNSSAAKVTDATAWNSASPTASSFSVGTDANVNTNAATYVTYLFASCLGVSKVGSYTGNGATQTINCGFASGARFVLIKRIDAAGDWLVLDTVRGIVSGNDPYLELDSPVAEDASLDLLTPQSVGFGLTSHAFVNASGGSFIYMAIS